MHEMYFKAAGEKPITNLYQLARTLKNYTSCLPDRTFKQINAFIL